MAIKATADFQNYICIVLLQPLFGGTLFLTVEYIRIGANIRTVKWLKKY